jgi:hypothetical protein
MSHTAGIVLNVVFVSAIYLISFNEQEDNTDQAGSHIIADTIDATAGLNIKGAIFVDELDKTPRNPNDILPVKFIYRSINDGLRGHGLAHTRATDQVREALISDFLNNIPDLTLIRQKLFIEKPNENAFPIANFTLYFVRRSDGYMSDLSDPAQENQERLVYHEQGLRTSGLATVNFAPQYDDTNIEHFKLCLSVLQHFSTLASELDCQNIWVTIQIGDKQNVGLCWKDGYKMIDQGAP